MTYISLFDRLGVLAEQLPVSHIVDNTSLGKFISALTHYMEHGEPLLDAADKDAKWLVDQLTGPKDQRGPGMEVPTILTANDPSPDLGNSADVAALQAQIDRLSSELQSSVAAQHVANTSVTVEPVPADPTPVASDPVTISPPITTVTPVNPTNPPTT